MIRTAGGNSGMTGHEHQVPGARGGKHAHIARANWDQSYRLDI